MNSTDDTQNEACARPNPQYTFFYCAGPLGLFATLMLTSRTIGGAITLLRAAAAPPVSLLIALL